MPSIPIGANARAGQIVAAAIMASIVVYAIVGVLVIRFVRLDQILSPNVLPTLSIVFVILGASLAGVSLVIRKALEAKLSPEGASAAERMRIVIVGMVLAETPAVLGLVYALLSASLFIPFVLWGISLGACILHFPSKRWLEGSDAQ